MMASDDKKEYRDTLEALDYTGSGPAVLNKIGKLAVKTQDPHLKGFLDGISHAFHANPQTRHFVKLRLLNWAHDFGANGGDKTQLAKLIVAARDYCRNQVASQTPAWQSIALSHGWTPPAPRSPA